MIEPLPQRQFLPALRKSARELLEQNTRNAEKDGKTYTYTVPSSGHYPFQWFWDSCFHAMVWAALGETERAKNELRSLFAWQSPSGFIPHVIFWDQEKFQRSLFHWHYWESPKLLSFLPWTKKPATSAFIQPPVLAQAIEYIYRIDGDVNFVRETLPGLERFYRFLAETRDPDNDNLILTITRFETGCDHLPIHDGKTAKLHPFGTFIEARGQEITNKLIWNFDPLHIYKDTEHHSEDVLVNSLYAQGLYSLARLAADTSRHDKSVSRETYASLWAHQQGKRVSEALLDKCYDEKTGLFWTLKGKKERPAKRKTVVSLMPLILPDIPKDIVARLITHLVDPRTFGTRLSPPSVAADEQAYAPDNRKHWGPIALRAIWSGASTGCTAKFIAEGLRLHGHTGIADAMWETWARECSRTGWHEFRHPITGEPTDISHFGWDTLIVTWPPQASLTKGGPPKPKK